LGTMFKDMEEAGVVVEDEDEDEDEDGRNNV
jgi:hypothetical protein